jgi:hypothetical protein
VVFFLLFISFFTQWVHYVERIIYIESFAQKFENVELAEASRQWITFTLFSTLFSSWTNIFRSDHPKGVFKR